MQLDYKRFIQEVAQISHLLKYMFNRKIIITINLLDYMQFKESGDLVIQNPSQSFVKANHLFKMSLQ